MKYEKLIDMITKAEKGYEKYKFAFKELEDSYKGVMNKELKDELKSAKKSRLYISKINAKVKRVADTFSESYFSSSEFVSIVSNIESQKEIAMQLQHVVNKEINSMKFYSIMAPIFQKIPFYGTAVLKVSYDDALSIEDIALDDIFFDPNAKDTKDLRYIVNNIYLTIEDIKEYQQKGIFDKRVDISSIDTDDEYERVKLQDIYYLKDNRWYLSTLYDKSIILRNNIMLNNSHPFVIGRLLPQIVGLEDDDSVAIYGEPVVASLLPLQKEFNIRRNQQIDTINQMLNPKIIVPANAGINPLDLLKPTGAIRSNTNASLQVVPTANIATSLFDVDRLDDEMSEISGISPSQNGVSLKRGMTATESSIISNESNVRLQSYLRSFNESFFEPLFERVAMLVWRYSQDDSLGVLARSKSLDIKVKINTGLGATNKEIQKNGLKEAFGVVKELIAIAIQTEDKELLDRAKNSATKIAKEILPLWGIKNIDDYLGEDDEQKRDSNRAVSSI
jgi:hypothetical protein